MPVVRRDEFPKFKRTMADLRRLQGNLKKYQANIAVNFFKDSFRRKGFIDSGYIKWKERKPKGKRKPKGSLMVVTGRLKNSIRILNISTDSITIGTDVPYAEVHNEGSRKMVSVKPGKRTATRKSKVGGSYNGIKKGRRKTIKIMGERHNVKGYSYKQNIPKREFIGDSELLFARIEKHTLDALETFFLEGI